VTLFLAFFPPKKLLSPDRNEPDRAALRGRPDSTQRRVFLPPCFFLSLLDPIENLQKHETFVDVCAAPALLTRYGVQELFSGELATTSLSSFFFSLSSGEIETLGELER